MSEEKRVSFTTSPGRQEFDHGTTDVEYDVDFVWTRRTGFTRVNVFDPTKKLKIVCNSGF